MGWGAPDQGLVLAKARRFLKALATRMLIAVAATVSSLAIAQENDSGLVRLPPLDKRKVLGIWLATTEAAPCTRSLEQVGADIYMVNRCMGGQFGDLGRRLMKSGIRAYVPIGGNNPHLLYVVRDDGHLELYGRLPTPMVLPPYKGTFPP
jgi:hypothetical protein